MSSITASQNLSTASREVFAIAERADTVLAGNEGLGVMLGFADIAASIGITLHELPKTERFLVLLAIESAVEHRGWIEVQQPGTPKLFRKLPARKHYRLPSESPVARARRG